ncbi:MAG: DUF4445 domain-containing protein [Eubacteriales bacterium]|nr:DUF4445 domain-containing protein [Eubacteriales bacterium]
MGDIRLSVNEKEYRLSDQMDGVSLLEALSALGVTLSAPCAGHHTCGKCKVVVKDAAYTQEERRLLDEKERASGVHLACCTKIFDGMNVTVETGEKAAILFEEKDEETIDPAFVRKAIVASTPSLNDQRDDLTRLLEASGASSAEPRLVRSAAGTSWRTAYLHHGKLVHVSEREEPAYGIAVDIGTTTVVGYLYDLLTGKNMDIYSALNAQRACGADVISRVKYCMEHETGLETLTEAIRGQIGEMTRVFCGQVRKEQIYSVTFTGNTVMMHLLVGADPTRIANAPFIPVFTQSLELPASDIGLDLPRAQATIMPGVSGFVGADTVAAALACGIGESEEICLLADIGTNGEIVLGNRHQLLACSVAAGPAFEGANISCGTGGVVGAIDHVESDMKFTTIGNGEAAGICGSGILDLTAVCLENGIISSSGRIRNEEKKISLTKNVTVTQKDIREIQLAKGAVCAGIRLLLQKYGISADRIERFYLAGGFGNYLRAKSAARIGMFPEKLLSKTIPAGNAAGRGAVRAMLSEAGRRRADELHRQIRYEELSAEPRFTELFAESMLLEPCQS